MEPWYSTEYSQDAVQSDWLSNWLKAFHNGCIHLPEPNPFISSEFSLLKVRLPSISALRPVSSEHMAPPGALCKVLIANLAFDKSKNLGPMALMGPTPGNPYRLKYTWST